MSGGSATHTKLYRIELLIAVEEGADARDVESLVRDLEWVGGCRDPNEDPVFSSCTIEQLKVKRGRRT